MISLIVGLILFIIMVIMTTIFCKIDLKDLIVVPIVVGIAAAVCLACCIIGNDLHVNEKEYLKLNFMVEHWNELSSYEQATIGEDIKNWNENLNNYNNYWFKFELEDRSMYYIELQK